MSVTTGRRGPDAEHRAQLRAVARRFHPDLGGDLDTYLAAVADLDAPRLTSPSAPFSRPSDHLTSGRAGFAHRARQRVRRGLRTAGRTARSRLPRAVPGSRRWARL